MRLDYNITVFQVTDQLQYVHSGRKPGKSDNNNGSDKARTFCVIYDYMLSHVKSEDLTLAQINAIAQTTETEETDDSVRFVAQICRENSKLTSSLLK